MEARIPFPGFYESLYDREIDDILERETDYILTGQSEYTLPDDIEQADIWNLLFKYADFGAMHREISKRYAEAFSALVNVPMRYAEMTSPREYNFETDKIFVQITRDEVVKLFDRVDKDELTVTAKKMFTSRSGFISFYDPDWLTWGDVTSWDHNQLFCLFNALLTDEEDYDWTLFYSLQEDIYNIVVENIDWLRIKADLASWDEDDERKYPPGNVTDTLEYIRQFEELNHLKSI